MAVDLTYLPTFLQELAERFDDLRLATVSELASEDAIFVQDGNHGEYRPRKDEFVDSGVPFIRPPNLEDGRIDFSKCDRINEVAFNRVRKGIGRGGDIILTNNATIGRLAITKPTDPVFVANPQTTVYRSTSPTTLDQRFLYYFMLSDGFQQQLTAHTGRNSTFDYVSLTKQRSLVIPIPPLPTQRKIASILSAYDDLIENNTRRIAILEEMAQAIYREWFANFRFPGHENVKLVDSPLGQIPEGWEVGKLEDVLVLQRGFDLPKKSRVPGNVPIFASTGVTGLHNEAKVKGPGVLTGRSGSLGTVTYIDEDFWPLNTTLWIKKFKWGTPVFAYYVLSGIDFETFNSGAAVPSLNRNNVHGLPTLLPKREVIAAFDEIAIDIFNQGKLLRRKNENLRNTRDLLLPKLISGKLDVKDLDIDLDMTTEALEEATALL